MTHRLPFAWSRRWRVLDGRAGVPPLGLRAAVRGRVLVVGGALLLAVALAGGCEHPRAAAGRMARSARGLRSLALGESLAVAGVFLAAAAGGRALLVNSVGALRTQAAERRQTRSGQAPSPGGGSAGAHHGGRAAGPGRHPRPPPYGWPAGCPANGSCVVCGAPRAPRHARSSRGFRERAAGSSCTCARCPSTAAQCPSTAPGESREVRRLAWRDAKRHEAVTPDDVALQLRLVADAAEFLGGRRGGSARQLRGLAAGLGRAGPGRRSGRALPASRSCGWRRPSHRG